MALFEVSVFLKMNFFFFAFTRSDEVNGIFKKTYNRGIVHIDVSGNSKQDINGTRQMTKPEYAVYPWDKKYDWCSNCMRSYEEHPWIIFSLQNRKMRINGYFLRAGCCYQVGCCCDDDKYSYCVDCCLYSWSLQISEDNKTWTEIHRIDRDYSMKFCKEKTYKFDKEYTATYIRLIQNEACPGWPPCLAINKIDFLGDVLGEEESFTEPIRDDDEDISIIGHISKYAMNN